MSSIPEVPAGLEGHGFPASKADQLLGNSVRAKPVESKLQKSAQQFEAILIAKWLEEAEASFAKLPGEENDPDADPGQDQFRSLAQQFLAESISSAGGLGIASMIVRHLQPSDQQGIENKHVNGAREPRPPAAASGANTNEY